MTPRTDGLVRVLPGRTDDEWLLLDARSADPTYVDRTALPDVAAGNLVDAELVFADGDPDVASATVVSETTFRFLRTDEPVFEAARNCFEAARAAGEAMNSRVTYGTDHEPNGVVYTFADQPGSRDLLDAFRDGAKPLEPLVDRAAGADEVSTPLSVWVIDSEEPFLFVYVVLDPDGVLEATMRDAYL